MKTVTISIVAETHSTSEDLAEINASKVEQAAAGVALGREAVASLQSAGLVVKSAVVSVAPRPGLHEPVTSTDLLAPEPAAEPVPA